MKKKTIALALVLVMAFGVTMGGTFAYLTSQDSVTNTFTVGNVTISMVETVVDQYGVAAENAGTTDIGNEYKLIPGHTYKKDPTITVGTTSENAWLFVKIDNGIADIEGDTKIVDQMTAGENAKWEVVDATNNVYAYKTEVKANDEITVFETFTLAGDAVVSQYENAKIIITAYAVQKDGFASAAAAWAATFGAPTQG